MITAKPILNFDNALDFYMWVDPAAKLHDWQKDELLRISGYPNPRVATKVKYTAECPLRLNLCTCNSAGKDTVIVGPSTAWSIGCQKNSLVLLTSASHVQAKNQTERALRTFCTKANARIGGHYFSESDMKMTVEATNGMAILYATDDAGKFEGFHPSEPDAPFMVMLNEVKSVAEDIIGAAMRCTLFNAWVEVSSPGTMSGHFANACESAEYQYPAPCVPGHSYFRRIDYRDCPHLPESTWAQMVQQYGENHDLVRSSKYALFTSAEGLFVIGDAVLLNYRNPAKRAGKRRIAIDVSLGGDETVCQMWNGNYMEWQKTFRITHPPALVKALIEIIRDSGLPHSDIIIDGGGIGRVIISYLFEAGIQVTVFKADDHARLKGEFATRGTECWWFIRDMLTEGVIHLPEDETLRKQLRLRRYKFRTENARRKQVEPKKIAKLRGESSPDRADTLVMAFSQLSRMDFQAERAAFIQQNRDAVTITQPPLIIKPDADFSYLLNRDWTKYLNEHPRNRNGRGGDRFAPASLSRHNR